MFKTEKELEKTIVEMEKVAQWQSKALLAVKSCVIQLFIRERHWPTILNAFMFVYAFYV